MIFLDMAKKTLRRIGSYQSGDTIAPQDAQDVLDSANDLLDSWSTDSLYVFGSVESVLSWITGQNQYKIGNPRCTDIGLPVFTGTVTGGSAIITGVTQIPVSLVAGSSYNQVGAGSTLTDSQNLFPVNTYVTVIGVNTVTMSGPAAGNSQGLDQITYTLPGDFPVQRPLKITSGYTRINQLDFGFDVYASQEEYNAILYKAQPGPWPTLAWYNNAMPYGILNVYQTPGQGASVHLFTDTILSNLTLQQTIIMPQGYARAFSWCLAKEIWPEYHGSEPLPATIATNAGDALKMITALNAAPAKRASYDRMLTRRNRGDAGFIMDGGYR
jgi:sucrose-6-phosphate hydrolase SacC (GH32 family)